jgi:predicted nucleic acid-binding protein
VRFLVVDASFVLNLILAGPSRARARSLATEWKATGYMLCAPTLWVYEITSVLCKSVHFADLPDEEGRRALAIAHTMGVRLFPPDIAQSRLAYDWTQRLGRAAAYDSFYLALSETLRCEFWTADRRLHNAINLPWLHLLGEA